MDPDGKWWINSKEKINWAVKKNGDWWLVPGSEDSEYKTVEESQKENPFSEADSYERKRLTLWVISGALGVSLALNVLYLVSC